MHWERLGQKLAGHASIDDIMQILPALGELCVEEGVPFAREDLVNTVGDLVDSLGMRIRSLVPVLCQVNCMDTEA